MNSLVGLFVRTYSSLRTSAVLLVLLSGLLLLNVVLPQVSVLGDLAFGETVARGGPAARFFLVTLGLGSVATSPVFLAVLGLFFLNLTVVLASRVGPTLRRVRFRPRSEAAIRSWSEVEAQRLESDLPRGFSLSTVLWTLRRFGFEAHEVGPRSVWGVKHRTAPVGFLLFHASFFVLCVGGLMVFYTRFVGQVVVTEQQDFAGTFSRVLRTPPTGAPSVPGFTLQEVEVRTEQGQPVHLEASLVLRTPAGASAQRAWVNHPARWRGVTYLVEAAGLSPVLWLQDPEGFTLDRVASAAVRKGTAAVEVPLAEGRWSAHFAPWPAERPLPDRAELALTPIELTVQDGERVLWQGFLRPGESVDLGDAWLELSELRYWARFLVVAERGGRWLVAGFLAAVVGLLWRLLTYRREVAVIWDDGGFRVVERGDTFAWRLQEELAAIREVLANPRPSGAQDGSEVQSR